MHYPDIGSGGIDLAARFIVARAVRAAASGLRRRRLKFQRPIDPRFTIGHTLSASANGVSGVGQVVTFTDSINFDTGAADTDFVIACPAGSGVGASASAIADLPIGGSIGQFIAPVLSNFVGADTETPTMIDDDALIGCLSNTTAGSTGYDSAAPTYNPQFRIIMPEVDAVLRDPTSKALDLAVSYSISTGSITIEAF